jgi:hypothetical protein
MAMKTLSDPLSLLWCVKVSEAVHAHHLGATSDPVRFAKIDHVREREALRKIAYEDSI